MKFNTVVKRVQSISGRYSQAKGTDSQKELVYTINRCIESVIHETQPLEMSGNSHFLLANDACSDVFIFRPYQSEDATRINLFLNKLSPIEIDNLYSEYTPEDTEWQLGSIVERSSDSNSAISFNNFFAYGNYSGFYSSGFFITYNETLFNTITGNTICCIDDVTFSKSTSVTNQYMQSKYVRAIIFDSMSIDGKTILADVAFQPYVLMQTVMSNGFVFVLNMYSKTLVISSNSIGAYKALVYSAKYPINTHVLLIKKDKLFSSSNIQKNGIVLFNNSIAATVIYVPPKFIYEEQTVPYELYSNKDLLSLIVYTAACEYSNLFGTKDNELDSMRDNALSIYTSNAGQDLAGASYGTIARMY